MAYCEATSLAGMLSMPLPMPLQLSTPCKRLCRLAKGGRRGFFAPLSANPAFGSAERKGRELRLAPRELQTAASMAQAVGDLLPKIGKNATGFGCWASKFLVFGTQCWMFGIPVLQECPPCLCSSPLRLGGFADWTFKGGFGFPPTRTPHLAPRAGENLGMHARI